ncbi:hypothetical protein GCM10011490_06590 [Pseudoclavibacter endophyticus]|nr:hypothetical protein GCM10011490_06590 [Pseudoclavibacter endophyticus]
MRDGGRTRAVRTLATAVSVAAAGAALAGCAQAADTSPVEKPITQLEAGDCFDTDAEFTTALVYPDCSAEHLFEAHHVEELDGDTFPGDDVVQRRANEVCDEQFQVFTGQPVSQNADYASMFLGPTEDSWMTEDDRAVVCVVMPADGAARGGSAAA